jgi:hypothetical protein
MNMVEMVLVTDLLEPKETEPTIIEKSMLIEILGIHQDLISFFSLIGLI